MLVVLSDIHTQPSSLTKPTVQVAFTHSSNFKLPHYRITSILAILFLFCYSPWLITTREFFIQFFSQFRLLFFWRVIRNLLKIDKQRQRSSFFTKFSMTCIEFLTARAQCVVESFFGAFCLCLSMYRIKVGKAKKFNTGCLYTEV